MSTAWLKDLEERVEQAAARIASLRDENAGLEARIKQLESALAEAPGSTEAAAWADERQEIQQRVGKLVDHLAGLLEGDS